MLDKAEIAVFWLFTETWGQESIWKEGQDSESGRRSRRVHDELIIECSPEVSLDAICEQMGRTPPWIPGIELRADGYECGFYQKQ